MVEGGSNRSPVNGSVGVSVLSQQQQQHQQQPCNSCAASSFTESGSGSRSDSNCLVRDKSLPCGSQQSDVANHVGLAKAGAEMGEIDLGQMEVSTRSSLSALGRPLPYGSFPLDSVVAEGTPVMHIAASMTNQHVASKRREVSQDIAPADSKQTMIDGVEISTLRITSSSKTDLLNPNHTNEFYENSQPLTLPPVSHIGGAIGIGCAAASSETSGSPTLSFRSAWSAPNLLLSSSGGSAFSEDFDDRGPATNLGGPEDLEEQMLPPRLERVGKSAAGVGTEGSVLGSNGDFSCGHVWKSGESAIRKSEPGSSEPSTEATLESRATSSPPSEDFFNSRHCPASYARSSCHRSQEGVGPSSDAVSSRAVEIKPHLIVGGADISKQQGGGSSTQQQRYGDHNYRENSVCSSDINASRLHTQDINNSNNRMVKLSSHANFALSYVTAKTCPDEGLNVTPYTAAAIPSDDQEKKGHKKSSQGSKTEGARTTKTPGDKEGENGNSHKSINLQSEPSDESFSAARMPHRAKIASALAHETGQAGYNRFARGHAPPAKPTSAGQDNKQFSNKSHDGYHPDAYHEKPTPTVSASSTGPDDVPSPPLPFGLTEKLPPTSSRLGRRRTVSPSVALQQTAQNEKEGSDSAAPAGSSGDTSREDFTRLRLMRKLGLRRGDSAGGVLLGGGVQPMTSGNVGRLSIPQTSDSLLTSGSHLSPSNFSVTPLVGSSNRAAASAAAHTRSIIPPAFAFSSSASSTGRGATSVTNENRLLESKRVEKEEEDDESESWHNKTPGGDSCEKFYDFSCDESSSESTGTLDGKQRWRSISLSESLPRVHLPRDRERSTSPRSAGSAMGLVHAYEQSKARSSAAAPKFLETHSVERVESSGSSSHHHPGGGRQHHVGNGGGSGTDKNYSPRRSTDLTTPTSSSRGPAKPPPALSLSSSSQPSEGSGGAGSSTPSPSMFEFRMNLFDLKSRDDFRVNYLKKLSYADVWIPQARRPPRHQTVSIFDWDDTLLCTSYINLRGDDAVLATIGRQLNLIEKHGKALLETALRVGRTFIITNAMHGWVEYSAKKYLPGLLPILENITVVSARHRFELDYPGEYHQWKIQAFLAVQKTLNSEIITNLLSVGDSTIEHDAVHIMGREFAQALVKTVKFRENPSPDELAKQLELVGQKFNKICLNARNLKIGLERKMIHPRNRAFATSPPKPRPPTDGPSHLSEHRRPGESGSNDTVPPSATGDLPIQMSVPPSRPITDN